MWLRHAHKLLFAILFLSACSPSDKQAVDKLNFLSYTYHYRNIDSVFHYARLAANCSAAYADGHAEALNNLAFVNIIRMDYNEAKRLLDSIPSMTDNHIELLVADVQQMRLCQRRSSNRDFYDYREQAQQSLMRINEERHLLNERQLARLLYAESEMAIVNSTYYYYIGLERQSVEALMSLPEDIVQDTAQFLNYLYNVGAGGIITEGTQQVINQQEFDYLLRCFQLARLHGYPYFEANALEALAEHLTDADVCRQLTEDNAPGMKLINPESVSNEELAAWLAGEALRIFKDFGDIYQIAGAYRTLASCYRAMGDNEQALDNLHKALADSAILQAPDLVASIREQLSVAYAAIDDKASSDENRNCYLDLQEQTRQDRQLEARAAQLDRAVVQLNWTLTATAVTFVLLLAMLWLFRRLRRRQRLESPLDDLIEERYEQLAVSRQHVVESKRRHLEQRAKISLVNSLLPLIERMAYTINRHGDTEYVSELVEQINTDNEMLTQWIQLTQGQLNLHIESFPLQPLFDMVMRSRKSFEMKNISLNVEPTHSVVKADRILTLFMLNTLADNARKFTSEGEVNISAAEATDYVEISVRDTGVGMDDNQLSHVFDHQLTTHGFGLLNCKGIIERYRKLSQLFSVCVLRAESEQGRGSRFYFRLPKGRLLRLLLLAFSLFPSAYSQKQSSLDSLLGRASIYADSAYFANVSGRYELALAFADSARMCLNEHYQMLCPQGDVLLLGERPKDSDDMPEKGDVSVTPPEVIWLHDSLPTNYNIILDFRNESAVAALALHQWQLYTYNNRIYTQLFKELSADATLADYCRTMQQTRTNRMIALVLLLLALMAVLPLYYFYYLRPRFNARFNAERQRRDDLELLDDELRRTELEQASLHVSNAVLDNCLSTLKHETMYYPSRISQLIEKGNIDDAAEVVGYYRDLYILLSQQAMSQVERAKIHLSPLEHDILGDRVLIDYLYELLRRMTGQQQLDMTVSRLDNNYIQLTIVSQTPNLNDVVSKSDILLCRQIVRDHGEATHRRGCSIRIETIKDISNIIIILPAYGKVQSYHR